MEQSASLFATRLAVVSEATRAETKALLTTKLARLWPGPATSLDAWMNDIDHRAIVTALHEDDYYREMSRCCLAKVADLEQGPVAAAAPGGMVPATQDLLSSNLMQLASPAHSTLTSSPASSGPANSSVPQQQQQQQQPGDASQSPAAATWPVRPIDQQQQQQAASHSSGGTSGRAGSLGNMASVGATTSEPHSGGGGALFPSAVVQLEMDAQSRRQQQQQRQGDVQDSSLSGGWVPAGFHTQPTANAFVGLALDGGFGQRGSSGASSLQGAAAAAASPYPEGFRRHSSYTLDPRQGAPAPAPLMLNKTQSFRFMNDPLLSPRSPRMCSGATTTSGRNPPSLVINTQNVPPAMELGGTPRQPPTFLHQVANLMYPSLISTSPLGHDDHRALLARQVNQILSPMGPGGGGSLSHVLALNQQQLQQGYGPPQLQLPMDGVLVPFGPRSADARLNNHAGTKSSRDWPPNSSGGDDLSRLSGPCRSRRLPQQTHAGQNMPQDLADQVEWALSMAQQQQQQQQQAGGGGYQQQQQQQQAPFGGCDSETFSGLQISSPAQVMAPPAPRYSATRGTSSSTPPGGDERLYSEQQQQQQQQQLYAQQPGLSFAPPRPAPFSRGPGSDSAQGGALQ